MRLAPIQLDRAAGTLLGQACGDALGVPYEFKAPLPPGQVPEMLGGGLGNYAPGEWSDDTQMAACIAEVAATGADLRSQAALDAVAERFEAWLASNPGDVGIQTRSVLGAAPSRTGTTGVRLTAAARAAREASEHTAGNGALMRTGPVALAHLGNDEALAEAARAVADLTHAHELAGDSCVLWCIAIDRAVREGRLDGLPEGLSRIPAERRDRWAAWIREAEEQPPEAFRPNGFTVRALQAAWSAIVHTPVPPEDPARGSFACRHIQDALMAAVRAGDDTDTIAAIAGALLGARWGASALPFSWRRKVHGWPGIRARDLQRLALLTVRGGEPDAQGWPIAGRLEYHQPPAPAVAHPHDPGVLLGTVNTTDAHAADAVVSLCRLGQEDVPREGVEPENHLEFWLIDNDYDNAHPAFVIDDAARAVAGLRDEGRTVLLHCVRAEMRTPAVAARYAVLRGANVEEAIRSVVRVLPNARGEGALMGVVRELGRTGGRRQSPESNHLAT